MTGRAAPSSTPERGPATTAARALVGDHPPARSLYIHTPFCFHKCHYCDFYSIVDTQDRQPAFIDRLIGELRALSDAGCGGATLQTVFVGGGTPSLLRLDLWERLLRALHELFELEQGESLEFTVECNPESASRELMELLRSGGVNRVSIGAQSFDPRHLKALERWHDPDNVERAVEAVRSAGIARQSIDLIFAIPGQTLHEWERDLRRALALGTTHLSCYNLTYEPGTAMTARLRSGEFAPIDEETEAAMFEMTAAKLGAAGLTRYEVSNYAVPGAECRHNLVYWRHQQWLAAGPSASGHLWAAPDRAGGSWRWKNAARLGDYLASDGLAPAQDLEEPDPRRALRERIMTGLRLAEGLDAVALAHDSEVVQPGLWARLSRAAQRIADRGLLSPHSGRWRLTSAGILLADGLAAELMAVVDG